MEKKYRIITIEREYGSGGSAVGKAVGEALGIPVYGREILEMAAKAGNTTPRQLEHLEETATNSLLYSLLMLGKVSQGSAAGLSGPDALTLAEFQIIEELARRGSCVIVGRCSGWALRERRDVLRVFLQAEEEFRLHRAREEYGISPEDAPDTLRAFDRRRANFYKANTALPWNTRENYHLIMDSGKLGLPFCVSTIVAAAQGKVQ